jgi:hypothetical protein
MASHPPILYVVNGSPLRHLLTVHLLTLSIDMAISLSRSSSKLALSAFPFPDFLPVHRAII